MAILAISTQLLDGTLEGPRIISSGSKMCKMFVTPRDEALNVAAKHIPHQYGLYILVGKTPQGAPKAYVGQTKDFQQRVRDHLAKKDFWDTALIFISKADEIYASEVLYLEYLGIQKGIDAGRYNMDENAQVPPEPSIAPDKKIEMEQFFEEILFFLKFYGCPVFEKVSRKKRSPIVTPTPTIPPTPIPSPIPVAPGTPVPIKTGAPVPTKTMDYREYHFEIKKSGVFADMHFYPKQDKYVILSGSLISAYNAPSMQPSLAVFRNNIFAQPTMAIKQGDVYQLLQDVEIPNGSPSAAAKFCAGTSRNGKTDWIDPAGHSIGDYLNGLIP